MKETAKKITEKKITEKKITENKRADKKTAEQKSAAYKTAAFIRRYGMIRPGDRILAAVSGGADSMCMLFLLKALSAELEFSLCAAHFEHGIRGEESLRDCAFVEAQCAAAGIDLLTEHGDVPHYAEKNGLGIEEAARKLRYDFLGRAAEKLHCSRIATAHNMEDNAETVLFHLARGTGLTGLTGISPVRGNIIRPVLCLKRAEIGEYLRENGIPHVEDSTNSDTLYARNRIRHKVLPELENISAGTAEAIFRTSELLRTDEQYLRREAEAFIARNGRNGISLTALSEADPAVTSRVIRELWTAELSMEQVASALRLFSCTEHKHLDLPGGYVENEQGRLYLVQGRKAAAKNRIRTGDMNADRNSGTDIVLRPGSVTRLQDSAGAEIKIICEEMEKPVEVHDLFNTFYLKCGEIYGPLKCTGRQPGDRLRIKERNCTKTLKSLFLEAGMTQRERDEVLVFRDDRGVLAAEGLAVAERAVPEPGDRVLKITVSRKNN